MKRIAVFCCATAVCIMTGCSGRGDPAQTLLAAAGSGPGLVLVAGDSSGSLAASLVQSGQWTAMALVDPARVASLRAGAGAAGVLNSRLFYEPMDSRWPLADRYADVVVLAGDAAGSVDEVVRVLVPGGRLLLRGKAPAGIAGRLTAAGHKPGWTVLRKPALAGASDWSHWNRAADNNTLSPDSALRLPFRTQFLQGPPMVYASLTFASAGRVLVLGIEPGREQELVCRSGYNGIELWRVAIRHVPGQADQRGDLVVAAPDVVYLAHGASVRRFDAATGAELTPVEPGGLCGAIQWIGLEGDRLYLADTASPTTVGAYDTRRAKTLWTARQQGTVDERMLAARDGQLVLYVYRKGLVCLDGRNGREVWANNTAALVDTLERGSVLFGDAKFRVRGNSPGVVLTPHLAFVREPMGPQMAVVARADGALVRVLTNATEFMNVAALYDDVRDEVYAIVADSLGKPRTVTLDSRTAEVRAEGAAGRPLHYYRCARITGSAAALYQHDGPAGVVYNRAQCDNTKVPANGVLYSVSGVCRCIEYINGQLALGSGDSAVSASADRSSAEQEDGWESAAAFATLAGDWTQYRADSSHSAGSRAAVGAGVEIKWQTGLGPALGPACAAGGRVFLVSRDGQVRCVDAATGWKVWTFCAGSAVRLPPTIWNNRAYVGSADGYLYCLEAATGRLRWRFRPQPVPQRMVTTYGTLASDRPVNSGAVVRASAGGAGTVFAAAGMLPIDGVSVYALDALSGRPRWVNPCRSPRPQPIAALGSMVLDGDALLMAGRTQPAPATFSVSDGVLIEPREPTMAPFYLPGREVMAWGRWVLYGGVYLYEFTSSLPTLRWAFGQPFSWAFFRAGDRERKADVMPFGLTAVPPAWDRSLFVCPTFMDGELCAWEPGQLDAWLGEILAGRAGKDYEQSPIYGGEAHQLWRLKDDPLRKPTTPARVAWGPVTGETRAVVVAADAVLVLTADSAVGPGDRRPDGSRASRRTDLEYDWASVRQKSWYLRALGRRDGKRLWQMPLPAEPVRDGLAVDGSGRIVVCLTDGRALCVAE